MNNKEIMKDFEKLCEDLGFYYDFRRLRSGQYENSNTHCAFYLYKAALSVPGTAPTKTGYLSDLANIVRVLMELTGGDNFISFRFRENEQSEEHYIIAGRESGDSIQKKYQEACDEVKRLREALEGFRKEVLNKKDIS